MPQGRAPETRRAARGSLAYARGDQDRSRLEFLNPGLRGDLDPPLRFYAGDGCVGHDLNAARRLDQALGVGGPGPDAPEVEKAKAWMAAMARQPARHRGSFQDEDVPNAFVAEYPRPCQSRRSRPNNDSGSHQPSFRRLAVDSGRSRMRPAASSEMRRVQ